MKTKERMYIHERTVANGGRTQPQQIEFYSHGHVRSVSMIYITHLHTWFANWISRCARYATHYRCKENGTNYNLQHCAMPFPIIPTRQMQTSPPKRKSHRRSIGNFLFLWLASFSTSNHLKVIRFFPFSICAPCTPAPPRRTAHMCFLV